jgi:hypothetical protein
MKRTAALHWPSGARHLAVTERDVSRSDSSQYIGRFGTVALSPVYSAAFC